MMRRGWSKGARDRAWIPRWAGGVLIAVLLLGIGEGAVHVRRRYRAASRRIAFQIQSAIDLEARALAQGDHALFTAQQDELSPEWYAQQAVGIEANTLLFTAGRSGCSPVISLEGGGRTNGPATVQHVQLRGGIAWVDVVTGPGAMRQAPSSRDQASGRGRLRIRTVLE